MYPAFLLTAREKRTGTRQGSAAELEDQPGAKM